MYDVLIIGCGISGAAAAFELSKYRLSIAVLEAENDISCGSTKANSAILHAGYDPLPGSLMGKLNARGSALAKDLCAKLDVPYRQVGSLVAAFSPAERDTLEELLARGRANGVADLQLLDGDAARALEPGLSPDVIAALYAPTAAICSPWEYCLALAETALKNGAELFLNSPVTAIRRGESCWQVHAAGRMFEARYIINAAGVFADKIHDLAAPHAYDIRPSRGQYYLMDKAEGDRVSHVVFQCPNAAGKGVLVAPTVHGNLIVGPNAEPVTGDDTATTGAGLSYVRQTAQKSVPHVNFRNSIRNFAGVRAIAGTDFILGEAAGAHGFFDLAGICSPGLSAAPATAEYLVGLMERAGLRLLRKETFYCTRKRVNFAGLSPAEQAALVARDPAYGRVICRCETITEGEILAALRAPIPPCSVDGVKRRCGAGMGRCQGGFCGPRVGEILCRELGLAPEALLQDRAGTSMLMGETKGGTANV
ncbi:MAG: NAD(P)/FAD-dependent oxidoreductase [Pseudoflavonifractor sp.]